MINCFVYSVQKSIRLLGGKPVHKLNFSGKGSYSPETYNFECKLCGCILRSILQRVNIFRAESILMNIFLRPKWTKVEDTSQVCLDCRNNRKYLCDNRQAHCFRNQRSLFQNQMWVKKTMTLASKRD